MSTPWLVEHFFRHEYGRLVATLARRVGVHELEAVEDAVQSALLSALEAWTRSGEPDSPSAWLFTVAHHQLVGDLRRRARRGRLLQRAELDVPEPEPGPTPLLASELQDDLLRLLFACCDDAIPVESQLALALKTLCGFDVREIAHRLFISEANVYKRLARARARMRQQPPDLEQLTEEHTAVRRPAVHAILYLMFTEGYLSSQVDTAIRRELCDEALRLAGILAAHASPPHPETCALLALMHLHAARSTARQDAAGGLLLLEEQDRSRWDGQQVQLGLSWLAESARGDVLTRYHVEAGIAAEHCLSPAFGQTRWDRIAGGYARLEQLAPSALHTLSRAVAVAEWRGPEAGLAVLEGLEPPAWLAGSHLWAAVLADLHGRCGHPQAAQRHRERALALAPTEAVRQLLQRRLRGPEP